MTQHEITMTDHIIDGLVLIGRALFKSKQPEEAVAFGVIIEMILENWADKEISEYYHAKITKGAHSKESTLKVLRGDFPRDDYPELYNMLEKLGGE